MTGEFETSQYAYAFFADVIEKCYFCVFYKSRIRRKHQNQRTPSRCSEWIDALIVESRYPRLGFPRIGLSAVHLSSIPAAFLRLKCMRKVLEKEANQCSKSLSENPSTTYVSILCLAAFRRFILLSGIFDKRGTFGPNTADKRDSADIPFKKIER